jgi:hypothetical protein
MQKYSALARISSSWSREEALRMAQAHEGPEKCPIETAEYFSVFVALNLLICRERTA